MAWASPGCRTRWTRRPDCSHFVCRMNTLKVALIGVKELKDEKGRGLDEGKQHIWCRVTLDSTGQSVETDVVKNCSTCWTGTAFNKKMSLCAHLTRVQPTPSADATGGTRSNRALAAALPLQRKPHSLVACAVAAAVASTARSWERRSPWRYSANRKERKR